MLRALPRRTAFACASVLALGILAEAQSVQSQSVKISQLPVASGVSGNDVVPVVQNSVTKQVAVSAIMQAPPPIGSVTPNYASFTELNNIVFADAMPGANAAAKINAALAKLGPTGGLVDARGLIGNQSWGAKVVISTPGTHLILGCATFTDTAGNLGSMISIIANNVRVEGCGRGGSYYATQGGTILQPSGTDGGVYAGKPSLPGVASISGLHLNDIGVVGLSTVSTGALPYGLYLQNVEWFSVADVSVTSSGAIQYGYELEGVEQGEIAGGAILAGANLANVVWTPFTYGGTDHEASGNGVHFHSISLQQSAPSSVNMLFAPGCCDDAEITDNHFVISKQALYNIDFESASSWNGHGRFNVHDNHFETFGEGSNAETNPNATGVYINNTTGVVVTGGEFSCAPAPYRCISVQGTSANTVISWNDIDGEIIVGTGVINTTVAHNNSSAYSSIVDSGVDTIAIDNRGNWNSQDKFFASGYGTSDILQFYPKASNSSPFNPSGANWGVTINGQLGTNVGQMETYLRLQGSDGSNPVTFSCLTGTGTPQQYCFFHAVPGDHGNWVNFNPFNFGLNVNVQFGTDNTYNIGTGTGYRPHDVYIGNFLSAGSGAWTVGGTGISNGKGAVMNANSGSAPSPIAGEVLQLVAADGASTAAEIDAFGGQPTFAGRRWGGTNAAPTSLLNANVLAGLEGYGYDGTAMTFASTGGVEISASEAWSATAHGTDVVMKCTAQTTTTKAECGRFNGSYLMLPTSIWATSDNSGSIGQGPSGHRFASLYLGSYLDVGGSKLTINGSGNLTTVGSVSTAALAGGAAATIAAGAATQVGTGATIACAATHVCDAISGEITLTTGTGTLAAGAIATVTFPNARTNVPNCVVNVLGGTTFVAPGKSETTSALTLSAGVALAPSTAYSLTYVCGGL